jgi:hypothetical protein
MKESEHNQLVKEKACDLIHVVTLDTQRPGGAIKDVKSMKRLQFIGIYAYKRDLEELGEPELASTIVNKGRTMLLDEGK